MKASIKILILSACLLAAGALIASAGFLAGGRGFFVDQGLHIIASSETERLEEKTALEPFEAVRITMGRGNVKLVAGDSYQMSVRGRYYEAQPSYRVEDRTLIIDGGSTEAFFSFLIPEDCELVVTIPRDAPQSVELVSDLGNVTVEGITVRDMNVRVHAGNAVIQGVTADPASAGGASVSCDLGDCEVKNSRLSRLTVTSHAGDVELENLSGTTQTQVQSDLGEVEIEKCEGNLTVDSDSGDVAVTLDRAAYRSSLYDVDLSVNLG